MSKKVLIFFSVIVLFLYGCSSYEDDSFFIIKDVEQELDYGYISSQAFMGGSMLYCNASPCLSQLNEGVVVSVRIGKIHQVDGLDLYEDDESLAVYGCIKVLSIDLDSIEFEFSRFIDIDNICSQIFKVLLNDVIDINNDNIPDITYIKPLQQRKELGDIRWLSFISSKDSLNTTMFATIDKQYGRSLYPNNLIGINPCGSYVFTKYENNSNVLAEIKGVRNSDYILDSEKGDYYRFIGKKVINQEV